MSSENFNRPMRQMGGRDPDAAADRRGPGSDPLQDLARLIGQSDPYAPARGGSGRMAPDLGDRAAGGAATHDDFAPPPLRGAPRLADPPDRDPDGWPAPRADFAPEPPRGPPIPRAAAADPPDPPAWRPPRDEYGSAPEHAGTDRRSGSERFSGPPLFAERGPAPERDGYPSDAGFHQPGAAAERQPPDDDPLGAHPLGAHPLGAHDPHAPHDGYASPGAAAYPHEDDYAEDEYDEHDDQYAYEDEPDDYEDEPEPPAKRRGTVKAVAAVLGVAVFGSAAAIGYSAIFKGGAHGTPVIRADTSPTKVVPPPSADAVAKAYNDRLSDTSTERMVPREETPVDFRDQTRSANVGAGSAPSGLGPSVNGFPSYQSPYQTPYQTPSTQPPSTGTIPPTATLSPGTKRVQTVTIQPDQASAPPPRRAAARPPASASGQPLALTPTAAAESPAAAAPRPQRTASVAPAAAPAAAPYETAAIPAAGASPARSADGFVVQLSAAKSEADAQTIFHNLQSKYAVLNGRQALIRRKDRGERGVFYATQVGPFGSKDEASQLCETLKTAGGDCFITKN